MTLLKGRQWDTSASLESTLPSNTSASLESTLPSNTRSALESTLPSNQLAYPRDSNS